MLVNEIKTYKLKLSGEEKEVELKLDFNALIKMHKEYDNAFLLIYSFAFQKDLSVLPAIIRCMADVELTEEEVKEKLIVNVHSLETLSRIILDLTESEIINTSEFKSKEEVKKNLQEAPQKK